VTVLSENLTVTIAIERYEIICSIADIENKYLITIIFIVYFNIKALFKAHYVG
jgi:hypothetical protein